MLAVLKPVFGLMKGIPTDHPLFSTYWRKRTAPPDAMNPDRDGCGLLWCSSVAPNGGQNAQKLTRLATELVLRHGFELAISLTTLTDRTLACIISVAYDRDRPGEDEHGHGMPHHLLESLTSGWILLLPITYRLHVHYELAGRLNGSIYRIQTDN
jgi:4-cresol dehydrogenase (hydroxylating)